MLVSTHVCVLSVRPVPVALCTPLVVFLVRTCCLYSAYLYVLLVFYCTVCYLLGVVENGKVHDSVFFYQNHLLFFCVVSVCLSDWLTDALGDMNRKRDSLYKYLHVCSIFNIFFNICWSSKLYYFSSHLLLKLLLILLRIAYTFTHICTPGFIPIWARFAPTTCLQLVIFEQIKPIFGVTGNGE